MKGGLVLATNFKILFHRSEGSLHLKLIGDFDGSSAHVLINAIESHGYRMNRFFIHTCGLRKINSFGKAVFKSNFCRVNKPTNHFVFTGENGNELKP